MNQIKTNIILCIFDLDGVVVDTAKYHYVAWKNLAKDFGYDLTKAKNELLKGVSRVQSLELILSWAEVEINQDKKDELLQEKNEEYLRLIEDLKPTETFEGFESFVKELKNNGIKISLGSASKNAIPILKKLGLEELFDYIVDGNMTIHGKPNPEVFLRSAEYFSIEPENCVVFEDAPKGIEAAQRGKMNTVGIGELDDLNNADMVWEGFKGRSLSDLIF